MPMIEVIMCICSVALIIDKTQTVMQAIYR